MKGICKFLLKRLGWKTIGDRAPENKCIIIFPLWYFTFPWINKSLKIMSEWWWRQSVTLTVKWRNCFTLKLCWRYSDILTVWWRCSITDSRCVSFNKDTQQLEDINNFSLEYCHPQHFPCLLGTRKIVIEASVGVLERILCSISYASNSCDVTPTFNHTTFWKFRRNKLKKTGETNYFYLYAINIFPLKLISFEL